MKEIRISKKCLNCGKDYFCPIRINSSAYLISLNVWNNRLYCSTQCVKLSDKVREKMSIAKIGKKQSVEYIEKRIKPLKGKKRPHFDKKWIENLSKSHMGQIAWNKGKKWPERSGENHHNWKGGKQYARCIHTTATFEYKNWRIAVFKRDNWKCKIENQDCNGMLEAHHILGWSSHPELRYQLNNGITLCHAHHPRKRAEEKRLFPYFMELVSESKEPQLQ